MVQEWCLDAVIITIYCKQPSNIHCLRLCSSVFDLKQTHGLFIYLFLCRKMQKLHQEQASVQKVLWNFTGIPISKILKRKVVRKHKNHNKLGGYQHIFRELVRLPWEIKSNCLQSKKIYQNNSPLAMLWLGAEGK